MQVNEGVYYTGRILTKELELKIKKDLTKRMEIDGFKLISPINVSSEMGGFRVMGEFRAAKKEIVEEAIVEETVNEKPVEEQHGNKR